MFLVKIILDMFVEIYGNQIEVVCRLKCSCGMVRKYVDDKDGKMYVIVNDVFYGLLWMEWKRCVIMKKLMVVNIEIFGQLVICMDVI